MATFAILHGGGDSASSWNLVAAELRELGHEPVAIDMPTEDESLGFEDYADAVAESVEGRNDLIVVAHSFGGYTAPLVCDRTAARMMVLVAAMIPKPGETPNEWWEASGYMAAAGEVDMEAHDTWFADVPDDLVENAKAAEREQAGKPMNEPWPGEGLSDIETRYVVCTEDGFLPAEWLRGLVRERLGVEPVDFESGHLPFLSRPRDLAALLDDLA